MITVIEKIGSIEQEFMEVYCLGKGWLWNLFFGLRETKKELAYYKISRNAYKIIMLKADNINDMLGIDETILE